jgi:hypothetical protein
VSWAFKHDTALKLPYQDSLSALTYEPTFKVTAGEAVFNEARVIITLGNRVVHSHRTIPVDDALVAVREFPGELVAHMEQAVAEASPRVQRPDTVCDAVKAISVAKPGASGASAYLYIERHAINQLLGDGLRRIRMGVRAESSALCGGRDERPSTG